MGQTARGQAHGVSGGLDDPGGDVPRMRQRSKCKSYVVLRGAILEQ